MFLHNFKYSLKTLFKNRMLLFWTYAFPVIMATFFYMAFSNIESSEKLGIINIAIVDNEQFRNNLPLVKSFEEMGNEDSDNYMFNIKYVGEDEAGELLADEKISGYLVVKEDKPEIVIVSNGINETIFKYVVEEIIQASKIVESIARNAVANATEEQLADMDAFISSLYEDVIEMVQGEESGIIDTSNANLSYTMIEFYTLIAMTCLYGGILGMAAVNQNLPNMTHLGKRVAVSPVPKKGLIFSSVIAGYIAQILGVAILFAYTVLALHVDYGDRFGWIIVLALAGSLAGLSMGVATACSVKTGDSGKTGILIAVTMVGCFFAGMMGITMKYIIDKNVPVINRINPASMITDGLYALYYYEPLDRYFINLASLLIFSLIMIGIAVFTLRRQKYDSI